jgi:hypothetical protein
MRKFAHETIILTKEVWILAKNFDRTQRGYKPLSETFIERVWTQSFRNGGANPATHPIADNEIRVDRDSFSLDLEQIKAMIFNAGYTWREDGHIEEGFYM